MSSPEPHMFISIRISSLLQKIDALCWTPHMDECLQVLAERKECPNDEILIQQVRLQRAAEKIAASTTAKAMESTDESGRLSTHPEGLRAELQSLRTSLLSRFQNNGRVPYENLFVLLAHIELEVVLLHLYSAEFETALSSTPPYTSMLTMQQRKVFIAGLQSIQSWFNVFFTIAPAAYISFPFTIFSHLARGLTTLHKLKTLDDPTWDESEVWKITDQLFVLDRVIENLEQVAVQAGLDNDLSQEVDMFSRVAQTLRSLRPTWEAKLPTDSFRTSVLPPVQTVDEITLPGAFGSDIFDSDWFTDLFLP
jgi:hypothetical protein